jgi:hypothetical protein
MMGYLVDFIQLCMPEATVHREVRLVLANPDGSPSNNTIIADIIVRLDHRVYVIDGAICDAGAATIRNLAARFDDHAALRKEAKKRSHYARALVAYGPPGVQVTIGGQDQAVLAANRGLGGVSFIPFVVEMTGRFGPAAKAFLEALQPGGSAAKTYFRTVVSTNIAKINSKLQRSTNSRLRAGVGIVANGVEGAEVPNVENALADNDGVAANEVGAPELEGEAEAGIDGAEAGAVAMEVEGEAAPDVAEEFVITNGVTGITNPDVAEGAIARRTRSQMRIRPDKNQHGARIEREENE